MCCGSSGCIAIAFRVKSKEIRFLQKHLQPYLDVSECFHLPNDSKLTIGTEIFESSDWFLGHISMPKWKEILIILKEAQNLERPRFSVFGMQQEARRQGQITARSFTRA